MVSSELFAKVRPQHPCLVKCELRFWLDAVEISKSPRIFWASEDKARCGGVSRWEGMERVASLEKASGKAAILARFRLPSRTPAAFLKS